MPRSNKSSGTKRKSDKGSGSTKHVDENDFCAKKKAKAASNVEGNIKVETQDTGDPDIEPYAVGLTLLVRWSPDGSSRLASVIERASTSEGGWRYYVHYHDFNRRMDEWVSGADRIIAPPSRAVAEATSTKATVAVTKTIEEQQANEDEEELVVEGYDSRIGSGALDFGPGRKMPQKSEAVTAIDEMEHNEHEGLDEASLKEHEEVTKVKNVGAVELGRWLIETWYFSPYPKEMYPDGYADCLYVCENTFAFFRHKSELVRWSKTRVRSTSPPGNEIYRHDGLAMFEVDGAEHTVFCQNLCYFAKLFLDHKTLYFDVDPFLFYVMCEYDDFGYHPVGYFSKEKHSEVGYNLACILTFPPYQRKGYGRFLIAFSYTLSRKEGKVGAPEKPLSDLGHVSYRSYWSATLVQHLREYCHNSTKALSIMELSKATSIMADDVIATLQFLGLIRCVNGIYVLWADPELLGKLATRYPLKSPAVDASKLHWTPYVHSENKRDKFSIKSKKPTNDD